MAQLLWDGGSKFLTFLVKHTELKMIFVQSILYNYCDNYYSSLFIRQK